MDLSTDWQFAATKFVMGPKTLGVNLSKPIVKIRVTCPNCPPTWFIAGSVYQLVYQALDQPARLGRHTLFLKESTIAILPDVAAYDLQFVPVPWLGGTQLQIDVWEWIGP
ncbi:MAG: hypothetical protein SFW36_04110 [Leptolyngbyaceae cyanobacterium bins.59]|nr:hypothetical protein [Leptolyngbyaceae cyanobacterium bins.59]